MTMADRTREQEQRRPDAEIILSTSASAGLVTVPVREGDRWEDTALLVTDGFERHENGVQVLLGLEVMPASPTLRDNTASFSPPARAPLTDATGGNGIRECVAPAPFPRRVPISAWWGQRPKRPRRGESLGKPLQRR